MNLRNVLLILPFALSGIWQATHADAVENKTWTPNAYAIRAKMEKIGFDRPLANVIINECKAYAKDPVHCIITASFIATAESSAGQNLTSCKNVFGITGGCYATRTEAVKVWVQKYVKFWFRRPDPSHFYSSTPKHKPASRYCMSEHSSGVSGYCPNGARASWETFNFLTK